MLNAGARPVAARLLRLFGYLAAALVLGALLPRAAWAWTPGTHIMLSEAVLRALGALPASVASLLQAFPYDFLYGSIAADTSIAKKYAAPGRHCHAWNVGLEIYDKARDEPLRAFALGYLTHLAADVVAHNYFVPRQLAVASRTAGLGHSYWESRFESHLGDGHARRAKEVILLDHNRSDDLLDRVLSPTIFSTPTNRRIFRGMVYVTDTESWQRVFKVAKEMSRHDLPDDDVERYVARAYDFVIDFLVRSDRSEPYLLDPAGEEPLRLAKVIRKDTLRVGGGGEGALVDEAARHFALPSSGLDYAKNAASPIIPGPWPPIAD